MNYEYKAQLIQFVGFSEDGNKIYLWVGAMMVTRESF